MSRCVHCNFCGCLPSATRNAFSISNCGHIYCQDCIAKGRLAAKCKRCSATAPRFIAIDRNISPKMQLMFKSPSQHVTENSKKAQITMKFQKMQRTMRFKGQQAIIKHEKEKRALLQSKHAALQEENSALQEQMRTLQRQNAELLQERRAQQQHRSRSRDDTSSRCGTRGVLGGDVSETSLLAHHTTSSSVSSNESATSPTSTTLHHHYLDPFTTPANGLKRFTTSTPKAPPGAKKHVDKARPTPRHPLSASTPSLASLAMEMDEEDDEILDVTPALMRATPQRVPLQQHPSLLMTKSTTTLGHAPSAAAAAAKIKGAATPAAPPKLTIDSDPILLLSSSSSSSSRPPIPKTPAIKKALQNLSMAERLSAPRSKTPQKPLLQPQHKPEVAAAAAAATPRVAPKAGNPMHNNNTKTPSMVPPATPAPAALKKQRPVPAAPITPIRIEGASQLPPSSAVSTVKRADKTGQSNQPQCQLPPPPPPPPQKSSVDSFKTPALPPRKQVAPRTMPAGMKTGGTASTAAAPPTSQQPQHRPH